MLRVERTIGARGWRVTVLTMALACRRAGVVEVAILGILSRYRRLEMWCSTFGHHRCLCIESSAHPRHDLYDEVKSWHILTGLLDLPTLESSTAGSVTGFVIRSMPL